MSEVLVAYDALSVGSSDHEELRGGIEDAARRHFHSWHGFSFHFVYTPLLLVVALPLLLIAQFGNARISFFVMASFWTFITVAMWRSMAHRILAARIAYSIMVVIGVYLWSGFIRENPSPLIVPYVAGSGFIFFLLVALPAVLRSYLKHRGRVREVCHPHDGAVVWAVRTAGLLHREREAWRSSAAARACCNHVENLAVEIERGLSLAHRLDPGDSTLRREFRLEGRRVAEAVRAYKRIIAAARGPEDIDRVVRSLLSGVGALVRHDREALLADAPDLPEAATRFREFIGRSAPGVALVALSFMLPLIPAIAAKPEVADTVRWVVLVMGVTTIFTASPDLSGRVGDVIGKALPFK
ncbi:hypothetical protein ACFWY6_01090 [Streptomyces sp. NPDC059037]|uniref:hypothetical protein n=1 Tax=Streptomyces sp. NPDC059037 TaxID=3346710 RepID=UPI003684B8FA